MKSKAHGVNPLNLLLLALPVALALEYGMHADSIYIFFISGLAIVPLAGLMGRATEALADRLGEGIGGLLNATFGNAAELIIGGFALKAGLLDLVKASITGSIIGNVLLVFGASVLAAGLKYSDVRFNRTAASLGSSLLILSAGSLVVPAIHFRILGGVVETAERELSFEIAIVLMVTYFLSLVFALKTHRHLYAGRSEHSDRVAPDQESWTIGKAAGVLTIATAGVAWMSELLVGAASGAAASLGMNEVFIGVILVAIVGNAAEHSTAIIMARKNRMDVAINIALGSSIQIALFVAPVLVFLSYWIAPSPMNLIFTPMEVVAVALTVIIIAFITQDGEANWMEGVQLIAVYVILAIAFFNFPR
jgi:Ca2+:H+ antiporter